MPDDNPNDPKLVPLAELMKERQKRQQLEQQLQQLQTNNPTQGGGVTPSDDEDMLGLNDAEMEEVFVDPAKGKAVMQKVRQALSGIAGEARQLRAERDREKAGEMFERLVGQYEIYRDAKLGDLARLKLQEKLATLGPDDDLETAVADVAKDMSARFSDAAPGNRKPGPPQPPPSGAGGAAGHLDLDKPPANAGDRLGWARAKSAEILGKLKPS